MAAYDNHVLPFLWLKGEAHETITEYLEQIAGADIREICLESRTHPEFCRDGWWADLRFIIGECKRLGLKIWLLDDAHFPTGYANGALAGENVDPALRKTVLKHRTVTVVGPQPSTVIKLGNLMDPTERFVGAATFDAAGAPLDLELSVEQTDGTPARLRFDAPDGIATVELYVTSQKTGFRDEYINMVDADSCRVLIDAVYEPTFVHLGDEFGRTIFTEEGLIEEGPFYASPISPRAHLTPGGILIDEEDYCALNENNERIEGLHCVGELAAERSGMPSLATGLYTVRKIFGLE